MSDKMPRLPWLLLKLTNRKKSICYTEVCKCVFVEVGFIVDHDSKSTVLLVLKLKFDRKKVNRYVHI